MELKDLEYVIVDDINLGNTIEIYGFEKGSREVRRFGDESEVELKVHFSLVVNKGEVKKFKISDTPWRESLMMGGSGNDYGWYLKWGSKLHREMMNYLFTGKGGKIRKNKLYK